MRGQFTIQGEPGQQIILQYGPTDYIERHHGVPNIGFNLWATPWETEEDKAKFLEFLNGILGYVAGNSPDWIKDLQPEHQKYNNWISNGPI